MECLRFHLLESRTGLLTTAYQTLKTAQEKSILSLKEETIHITNGQMFYNNKGECGIVTDVMTGGLLEVTRILACC